MSVAVALVVGFLAARALVLVAGPALGHAALERENYRGRRVPTAGGVVVVVAVALVEAGRAAVAALGVGDAGVPVGRALVLLAVVGFGFLGFVDDVLGDGDDRGFRGHLRALARGRVTTGMLKLAGGGGLALVLVVAGRGGTGGQPFVDAAVVALGANLGNLLDRAPGRTTKFALVAYVPVAVACGVSATGAALAALVGAACGLLADDLRERLMLGDVGANAIGAGLGLALVLETGPAARVAVAVVLLLANVASEFVSFSRVIERTPPLRAFDALGRGGAP